MTDHPKDEADRSRAPASGRLLDAGLDCFAARGYHATTTRDIAQQAGMSPAAVYVHYPSKGELLYRISLIGHQRALEVVEQAAAEDHADPVTRIARIVQAFAGWHARNHRLARVAQYELKALPAERKPEIRALRQRVSELVEDEVAKGVAAGRFHTPDVPGATLGILSLCIDIARWYGPSATRTDDQLASLYADLATRMLAATAPAHGNGAAGAPVDVPAR